MSKEVGICCRIIFYICFIFGGVNSVFYLCNKSRELSRTCLIGKLISFINSEASLLSPMAGRALRGMFLTRRITKVAKHSNLVIRSLFISTVRLFLSPFLSDFIKHTRCKQLRRVILLIYSNKIKYQKAYL